VKVLKACIIIKSRFFILKINENHTSINYQTLKVRTMYIYLMNNLIFKIIVLNI